MAVYVEHECVYRPVDMSICPGCMDHAEFCEDCGESECCGMSVRNYDEDYGKDR